MPKRNWMKNILKKGWREREYKPHKHYLWSFILELSTNEDMYALIHHTPMFEFCMKCLELEYQSPLTFWGQEGKNQTKTICERKKKKKTMALETKYVQTQWKGRRTTNRMM